MIMSWLIWKYNKGGATAQIAMQNTNCTDVDHWCASETHLLAPLQPPGAQYLFALCRPLFAALLLKLLYQLQNGFVILVALAYGCHQLLLGCSIFDKHK